MPPYYASSRHPTSGRPTHTYVARTHGRHHGRRTHETRDPVRYRPRHGHGHHRQVGHYSTPRHTTHQTVRHHSPKRHHAFERAHIIDLLPHYHAQHYTVSKGELVHGPLLLPVALRHVDALPESQPDLRRLRYIPPPSISPTPYVLFPLNDPFHPPRDVWEPLPIQSRTSHVPFLTTNISPATTSISRETGVRL